MESSKATIIKLHSSKSPILDVGFVIELTPPRSDTVDNDSSKKKKKCAQAIMLKQVAVDLDYLETTVAEDGADPRLDEQILAKLYDVYRDNELGYADDKQKKQLKSNTQTIKNAMCVIEKSWKALLRTEFPNIPQTQEKFDTSVVLTALSETERLQRKE